ncbi:MAG: hypothetical protein LUI04_03010, partial [Porphyromonadaceae bacterium]|nr:hypothetical protein [Porphyromonadaceae bacterium]
MKRNSSLFCLVLSCLFLLSCSAEEQGGIDRKQVVDRNAPQIGAFDAFSSLSVGNGEFACTVDITGLQSYPEAYTQGVPLGTQSQWGWHSFPNPQNYRPEETLKAYDFGRGREELYAVQFNEPGRQREAAEYYRVNPHRLHLGIVGLELTRADGEAAKIDELTGVDQTLDLWNGEIRSRFFLDEEPVEVVTVCDSLKDAVAAQVVSPLLAEGQVGVKLCFPYPTGGHADDACNWTSPEKHTTTIISQEAQAATLERCIDGTRYYVRLCWEGAAEFAEKAPHYFVLTPQGGDTLSFTCTFTPVAPAEDSFAFETALADANAYWNSFWSRGGVIDFSRCKDSRAPELERRVVLSQYLMAIQCAGSVPPQESGLTYNTWYGKFHLEMIWWHAVHFALWGRPELMERCLAWYADSAYDKARAIAERQGFDGVRWMKMTDPSAIEAPSKVGSFLIWQQPHIIYMAELLYRANPSEAVLEKYGDLVAATADFMYSFATYDEMEGRFVLKGAIPAQETLRASETVNPPFELSYWYYAMNVAQQWRERQGLPRNPGWDELIDKLSPLAYQDGLYLAAETATDTYKDIRFTSDHMAVLGAYGILPKSPLVREDIMQNTLDWVWDNWNWGKTWGWDFAMTAMDAARLGDREKAIGALLMDKRTNTY